MGALAHAHRQGKALYVGISSYSPELTRKAHAILKAEGVPLLIHQPSYSLLNRWIEGGLLDTLEELGVGCIAFSPLAQGMLTDKYLGGVPSDARAVRGKYFPKGALSEKNLEHVRALNNLAQERGQTLAQMAISWVLRDERITSALIGARNVQQLEGSLAAVRNISFTADELGRIDQFATDAGIDIWKSSLVKETV
jgi:L-glyceraldehyde 3-phosphate reductase